MNKKFLFPLVFSLAIILGGCFPKPQNPSPVIDNPPTVEPSEVPIVGGDADEHGCIGSAGYSWCEDKGKCIRIWEEDCGSASAIKTAIAKKDNITTDFTVTIKHENTKYASGGISFDGSGGGMFLAAKIGDEWQIIYSGNGSIDCVAIKNNYDFTPEMLQGFCD
ncbi:MAG: hypothetical protein WC841_05880 [Candidatus Shapirobacteria bacterium]|jgi:hypothetical protein